MRARIDPGRRLEGSTEVPGDKSIAHRWLILAATADGPSLLSHLPPSLDVVATARCLASLTPSARPALERWIGERPSQQQGQGFTWDLKDGRSPERPLEVHGEGRNGLVEADQELDCANSGSTMRLLTGVLAPTRFRSVLVGDESLMARPMDRVATPLRAMGAEIRTTDGHPPLVVVGRELHGTLVELQVPSAQVKSAVLLAGAAASGTTTVLQTVPTRDHTERALQALGAPIVRIGEAIGIRRFQHSGFEAVVPGDASSAAFVAAAAALTGSEITVTGVGLNPTRTRYLDIMSRMGLRTETHVREERLGEPVGELHVLPADELHGTQVTAAELPLVIDEVPVLAALAAHARGDTWFLGAGELRVKESDRLVAIAEGIGALGGHAAVEGDDLILNGGGLEGGRASGGADHRMAMALAVTALAAERPSAIEGIEAADVSFPGFVSVMAQLGASIEVQG